MLEYLFDDVPGPGQVREIVPGVLWLRMPLPMALDHINLYLLEDHDGWWIVDTGIAIGQTQELWEQVFAEHLQGKPVKAVISTHYHPDHTGMAGWLCEKWRVPFYMTQGEYLSGLSFSRTTPDHFSWTSEQFLQRGGYSPATDRDFAAALWRIWTLHKAHAHGVSAPCRWRSPQNQWQTLAGGRGQRAFTGTCLPLLRRSEYSYFG